MQCMNILNPKNAAAVSEDSLVKLIRERLAGLEHAAARAAIASLIEGIR
ncbi:HTH cro/C1-type domain-containing protein [Roseateles saccharophilus]|uniref:Uncharacterized protein n=2 Tax=Roseateles saccharophilus TaxID=304 RepID=A0A4R3VG27_ROSSA|nr:hypothetical protein EV671_1001141 [Roseateles saccharophilus]